MRSRVEIITIRNRINKKLIILDEAIKKIKEMGQANHKDNVLLASHLIIRNDYVARLSALNFVLDRSAVIGNRKSFAEDKEYLKEFIFDNEI